MFLMTNLIEPRMEKLIINHLIGNNCPEFRHGFLDLYFFKLIVGSDCLKRCFWIIAHILGFHMEFSLPLPSPSLPPQRNIPWLIERDYLTKKFHSLGHQEELVGVVQLHLSKKEKFFFVSKPRTWFIAEKFR